jgi:hypothetical protein
MISSFDRLQIDAKEGKMFFCSTIETDGVRGAALMLKEKLLSNGTATRETFILLHLPLYGG